MPFSLSTVERLSLANQFRILCKVDPEGCNYYQWGDKIKILENGYEGLYHEVLGSFEENRLSANDCQFVADVLNLATWMVEFKDQGIDVREFTTVGFDGNHESEMLGYARYLLDDVGNNYPGVETVANSHHRMRERYKAMLDERATMDGRVQTPAEAARIIKAGALGLK